MDVLQNEAGQATLEATYMVLRRGGMSYMMYPFSKFKVRDLPIPLLAESVSVVIVLHRYAWRVCGTQDQSNGT